MSIGTRLHVLREFGFADPQFDLMMKASKFFVGADVLRVLTRDDIQSSISAMIEAGIARLPFSPLLIEYDSIMQDGVHHMDYLEEKHDNLIHAHAGLLIRKGDGNAFFRITRDPAEISFTADHRIKIEVKGDEIDGTSLSYSVMVALMMLNVKGIEKEVITSAALNRSRVSKGKGQVPEYTTVRIGTVYDRSGNAVRVTDVNRHIRVHLRRGHIRHQAHGEGMTERKIIFIPPVLVNYRGEGDAVVHPTQQRLRV